MVTLKGSLIPLKRDSPQRRRGRGGYFFIVFLWEEGKQ